MGCAASTDATQAYLAHRRKTAVVRLWPKPETDPVRFVWSRTVALPCRALPAACGRTKRGETVRWANWKVRSR